MKFCPHFWAVVRVQGHIAQIYKTKGATCTWNRLHATEPSVSVGPMIDSPRTFWLLARGRKGGGNIWQSKWRDQGTYANASVHYHSKTLKKYIIAWNCCAHTRAVLEVQGPTVNTCQLHRSRKQRHHLHLKQLTGNWANCVIRTNDWQPRTVLAAEEKKRMRVKCMTRVPTPMQLSPLHWLKEG